MAATGIHLHHRCSRILLLLAAAVVILGLLAAAVSAREVRHGSDGGRYEVMKHGVPSGPNPGSNLSPRLPGPPRSVAVEANDGGRHYELMKQQQQRVSTQHDVPSGPNPGSNLSPRLPGPPHGVAVDANGGRRYEMVKQQQQQRVSTQHDVPSGPNPGSNLSPRLPGPPREAAVARAAHCGDQKDAARVTVQS